MSATPSTTPDETLRGVVRRVRHRGADGWSVLDVAVEGEGASFPTSATLVGRLPVAAPGETVEATGKFETHVRYGRRFLAAEARVETPTTVDGIVEVLAATVPGVGPAKARKLVESLGGAEAALRFLDGDSVAPAGSDSELVQRVARDWRTRRAERGAEAQLASLGIPPALRERLRRRYGSSGVVDRVRRDPYSLAAEVDGVGFRVADGIARSLGVPPESTERLEAAVRFVLREESETRGHVFHVPIDFASLVGRATETVFPVEAWRVAVANLSRAGVVVVSPSGNFAAGALARDEGSIAREVVVRASMPTRLCIQDYVLVGHSLSLTPEQVEACLETTRARFRILTGGPGTGKTTVTKAIADEWSRGSVPFTLVAPTGRAARRLAEATGRETSTIHRLLEARGTRFGRDEVRKLDVEACLVDEASMVDVPLLAALLRALPASASLVLVGDADQLPPVGPGAPFRDLVASLPDSVSRLTRVHRQAAGSRVVGAAAEVLAGKAPRPSPAGDRSDGALYVIPQADPELLRATVVELVADVIPQEFDAAPPPVLTPRRRGPLGVRVLNAALQARLNPPREGAPELVARTLDEGPLVFRTHDRVIQTKNDYDRGVVNGDVGVVGWVSASERKVVVRFDDREVTYEGAEELRELDLAYATTVHKAQGSEAPVVVTVVHGSHGYQLDRTLLYTALTRAKRAAFLVGEPRAIERAVRTRRSEDRRTTLPSQVEREMEGAP